MIYIRFILGILLGITSIIMMVAGIIVGVGMFISSIIFMFSSVDGDITSLNVIVMNFIILGIGFATMKMGAETTIHWVSFSKGLLPELWGESHEKDKTK